MSSAAERGRKPRIPTAQAQRVGVTEFRGGLAKYLKLAKSGRPVVIQERGRARYVLLRLDDEAARPIFGCMRERTVYTAGAVVQGTEDWSPGELP